MSELLFKDKRKKSYTKKNNSKIKTTTDNRHNQKLNEINELDNTQVKKRMLKKLKSDLEQFSERPRINLTIKK